jgi:serine protease Do
MIAVAAILVVLSLQVFAAEEVSDSLESREEAAVLAAAERVSRSVVQIRTIGGLDSAGQVLPADGPTSGLIISADGYILSSTFNFTQQPASIVVTLPDGKQTPAELAATDHSRKLVLLKVNGVSELSAPALAPADEIAVGQWAVAIGRTFRTDRVNVSVGIVSAVGRMFGKVLQTDAAVSTANYGGPLVDIRGRVLGVIVPIAPQGAGEVAGAEWYDSGIGFAVPLASINAALERMKQGEDLHAGVLGVGFAPKNPLSSPAKLATVRPGSPASRAGLKKGDRIVEVDRKSIETQAQLRFALGPRYEGEEVRIVALRGDERIEKAIRLAGELEAFRHAFLGILPMRPRAASPTVNEDEPEQAADAGEEQAGDGGKDEDSATEEPGVVVRMVYPDSPAAKAGIIVGDRILKINGSSIGGIAAAIEELNSIAPGDVVSVHVVRGSETLELSLTSTRMPTSVPKELPPAPEFAEEARAVATDAAPEGQAPVVSSEMKLAEFPHNCRIYVPSASSAGEPPGLLLWLPGPTKVDTETFIRDWKSICDRDSLILVVPSAANGNSWERPDMEYLYRLTQHVLRLHKPDRNRIVVGGSGSGGALAWWLSLGNRELYRGAAVFGAPVPRQIRVPDNEPSARFSVLAGISNDAGAAAQIGHGLQKLTDAGYPVTALTAGDQSGGLSADERDELARWIDSLDRL